ncbi:hypothetical protein KF840_05690 [bacterium]|nr:hypothetical protein [bacterium]
MNRIAAVAMVIAAISLSTGPAAATLLQSCCACVKGEQAQTSGAFGANPQVYFCAEAQPGDIPGLEERCDAVSDQSGTLHCEANIPGPTCRAQLADGGLFCPAAGAPAAAPLPLAALAIALAILGAATAHRRRPGGRA